MKKTSHRLWIPIAIVILALGTWAYLALQPELERNLRGWATGAIVILSSLLLFLWFLFLGRFHWKTRLIGLLVVAGLWFGGRTTLRVDGTGSGIGLPKFTWKWTQVAKAPNVTNKQGAEIPEAVADAIDVPQFFGPKRDGQAPAINLDPDWESHPPKELWRVPVGDGWSAFAVSGGRAFTMEQLGAEETTLCYDLGTGTTVWTHADQARFEQWQAGIGPHATPAVSGGKVYTYGATGILNCLDALSGKLLWSTSVLETHQIPNLEWGVSASPLVTDGLVIVTGADKSDPMLLAYDSTSGELRWKAGGDKASYAAPLVARLAGRPVIVSNNRTRLTGHDPETGRTLFDFEWQPSQWPRASQPVIIGEDQILLSAGYGLGCSLLKVSPQGSDLAVEEVWHNLKLKTQFNSAALRDGHVFGLDDGRFACIRVADGERLWKEGRFGSGQSLLIGEFALIQSERGDVVLARISPETYEEVARLPALTSKTWNHPVLAGPYLLVRNDEEAACYKLPVQ